jgi:U4/U6 small nuclear ribonucleoprotein PRP31
MSNLADSFLDDLDDLNASSDEEESGVNDEGHKESVAETKEEADGDSSGSRNHEKKHMEVDGDNKATNRMGNSQQSDNKSIRMADVVTLRKSQDYKNLLSQIGKATAACEADARTLSQVITGSSSSGSGSRVGDEESPRYKLMVKANTTLRQLEDEVTAIYTAVAQVYGAKFPELEGLVPSAAAYLAVVERVQNETDMTLCNLLEILPPSQAMVVTVASSATMGRDLAPAELRTCLDGCAEAKLLAADRRALLGFVEACMQLSAPGLCALVGAPLAAQLVGLAGGLEALSRIPACNVQVMGHARHSKGAMGMHGSGSGSGGGSGSSSAVASALGVQTGGVAAFSLHGGRTDATLAQHAGVLSVCDLVRSVSSDLRRNALKMTAAKVVLLARLDIHATGN